MAPLKVVLNDRSEITGEEEGNEVLKSHRNPFGDSDSSESESEKPKVRHISSLSTARPQPPPERPEPPSLPCPTKTGPKGSQIANLVARRKEFAVGLGQRSREARDGALFQYDVDRCGEEASAAGYAKRPVEGFGELMLRGMGWKGTPDIEDVSEPTPRPARLGLGAKVEDLPAGLSGKRHKQGMKRKRGERVTGITNSESEVMAGGEGARTGIDEPGEDGQGITAESSGSAQVKSNGNEIKGHRVPSHTYKVPDRQRRMRSRFSDR